MPGTGVKTRYILRRLIGPSLQGHRSAHPPWGLAACGPQRSLFMDSWWVKQECVPAALAGREQPRGREGGSVGWHKTQVTQWPSLPGAAQPRRPPWAGHQRGPQTVAMAGADTDCAGGRPGPPRPLSAVAALPPLITSRKAWIGPRDRRLTYHIYRNCKIGRQS